MGLSGRRLTLTLTGTLIVVLVLGAGAALAIGRAQRVAAQHPSPGSASSTADGSTATSDDRSSRTGDPADAGPAVAPGESALDAAPRATPTPDGGSGAPSSSRNPDEPVQVTLSPSAEAAPHAAEVTGLIRRYFTAINRHDFDAWLTTVSTGQAKRDPEDWLSDYRTTYDSNIYISDINPGDPMTVRMQFVSHQSVELAPSGLREPCVRWDVTYQIVDEGVGLRVGTSAKAPSMAPCT